MEFSKKIDYERTCTLCVKSYLLARSYKYVELKGCGSMGL